MADAQLLWRDAAAWLRGRLGEADFQRYFGGVVPLAFVADSRRLTLGVPSLFMTIWLKDNYGAMLAEQLAKSQGNPISVHFQEFSGGETAAPAAPAAGAERRAARPAETPAGSSRSRAAVPRAAAPAELFSLPAPGSAAKVAPPAGPPVAAGDLQHPEGCAGGCRPDMTFETFVVGPNNHIPEAAAHAVCENPGHAYNPLFLYGGVGLGKTHLLQAIANRIAQNHRKLRIRYISSEDFVNQYIEAIQAKTLAGFRRHFRALDVLLIDDIQFFEGKFASQEEFFHTFNALYNSHKQIVLASDRTPREISGLEQRLVSRFDWGLSAQIMPPTDPETRMAILRMKQRSQKHRFGEPVLELIAKRIQSNIRNLESALTKLVLSVSAFGGEMTVARAEELLRDKFEQETSRVLTIDQIQKVVAELYDVRMTDLMSKKRPNRIALPRMVGMYLARELTNESLPTIGEAFNRNHATVIHAVETIKARLDGDEVLRGNVAILKRQLRS